MSSPDAIGVFARRRDGAVSNVDVEVALAEMKADDAVGERPIRIHGEVPGDDADVACAFMIAVDAVGAFTHRREVAARQFHTKRSRLPVVANGDASRVRGDVGGGKDRNIARIGGSSGSDPNGAIAGVFRVLGNDVDIIAGLIAVVVDHEVIGEPDREVAVRLVGAVEDVAA